MKNIPQIIVLLFAMSTLLLSTSCRKEAKTDEKPWSVKMAQSEMQRFPQAWMIEKSKTPRWGYTHGCVAKAMLDLFDHTNDSVYYNYAKGYIDTLTTTTGQIKTYSMDKYNIDNVNPGKLLFRLYNATQDTRYTAAIDTLAKQMEQQPRTVEGGFWHKQIYPFQMWLDGLYMASPFLAEYARDRHQPQLFDEVVKQIRLMDKNSYDPSTSLYYHGWNENKTEAWADKTTGRSPNFWTRSIGWYAMALVDVLDFLPHNHEGRADVIDNVQRVAKGIAQWQDPQSGVWYQLTAMGNKEGNYLESSGSAMFVAFLYKAIDQGYIGHEYKAVADKGFNGLVKEFIRHEEDGTYTITSSCAVAGLGGKPRYRDGSYEYYISEPIIDNDPKAVAPFIWAAIGNENAHK